MIPHINLLSQKQKLYILPETVEEIFAGLSSNQNEKKPDFQKIDIETTSAQMEL